MHLKSGDNCSTKTNISQLYKKMSCCENKSEQVLQCSFDLHTGNRAVKLSQLVYIYNTDCLVVNFAL